MKCPICHAELRIAERQGIEIDYCPACRGVWLDRGELDKIIERSAAQTAQPVQGGTQGYPAAPQHQGLGGHGHSTGGYGKHRGQRKSWLQEIFD